MLRFGRRRAKPSNAALFFAILLGIGLESQFLRIVWSDVAAKGFKSAVSDHLFATGLGFVLWGALPAVFFLISRELKKQEK